MKSNLIARMGMIWGLVGLFTASISQAGFSGNSLVVMRLSGGSAAVTEAAQSIFLDEYDVFTGALIASHEVPSTGDAALTLSGRGEHDGHLNLSSDGRYLLMAGYRAEAGTSNPVTSNALRTIGRVDASWNVDTTTTLEAGAYNQTYITAVVSDNGERFWTVGDGKYTNYDDVANNFLTPTTTGGLRYVPSLGAMSSVNLSHVQTITTNETGKVIGQWPDSIRNARIVDGQLYITTPAYESFGSRGAYATVDQLPMPAVDTPQALAGVINNVEGQGSDPKGKFVPKSDLILLDLDDMIPGVDTAYTTGGKNDYEKWSLVNGTWTLHSTKLLASGQEINAFDAMVVGNEVTLFASTDQGIYRLVDSAGYNADFGGLFGTSPFIAAGSSTEFRGIALVPEPTTMALFGLMLLAWTRRR